ncbi:hypothetical protein CDV31_007974 [Fusarium ambrosium]|uniref:Uncharacterized protein n=1 Tax=Fusarium ambrosium TaxID=131363 RepID=A0A428U3I9_9HYPO|nr:hypothetical protein CDV31_007974 [Fusarium ambrosium]
MSTNSGESGFCKFCGHPMNGHTKSSLSKCKNCKKRMHVCQVGVHAEGDGWIICDVACGCGPRYYPSVAKQARPLAPSEYASSHPLYEPPPDGEDEDEDEDDETSIGSPSYVTLAKNGDYLQFFGHGGELISTFREHWQQTTISCQGGDVDAWRMEDDTGQSYFTWTLDVDDNKDDARTGQSERSLGKQVAHAPQSTSHGRTLSAESIDPLQWSEEQLEANTLTPAMEELTIGGGSSQKRVHGTARLSSKGTVVFKAASDGKKVNTARASWVKVKGGFIFESNMHRCTFFTKEITPPKK